MIAEDKKQALLSAIAQVQDEAAFNKIAAMVEQLLAVDASVKPTPAGFLHGSVIYLTEDWDAPLADTDWTHNSSEW